MTTTTTQTHIPTPAGRLVEQLLRLSTTVAAETLWPGSGETGREVAAHLAERPRLYLTCRRCRATASHCPCDRPDVDWAEVLTVAWREANLGDGPATDPPDRRCDPCREDGCADPLRCVQHQEWLAGQLPWLRPGAADAIIQHVLTSKEPDAHDGLGLARLAVDVQEILVGHSRPVGGKP